MDKALATQGAPLCLDLIYVVVSKTPHRTANINAKELPQNCAQESGTAFGE